ncbi:MAG: PEGA domain-containing protein [Bacteroidota bacterium]
MPPPPRTAPPPSAPPKPLRSGIHPLAFIGLLVAALGLGLGLLLLPEKESEELTEAEVQALVHAAADPTSPSSTDRWTTPAQPSTLRLTTEPLGAEVRIDGRYAGLTPLELDHLGPDFYDVTLRLPGHAPLDTALYLASGSVFALDVAMTPRRQEAASATPDLVAASTDALPAEPVPAPDRPRTSIDQPGTPAGGGAAPRRPAPKPSPRPSFASASPEDLQRVSHTGSLSVSSKPVGAEVLIDGVPHGRAPLSLSGLRPGFYVVTLTLPGETPVSYRAEVTAQAVSVVKGAFPRD